MSEVYLDQLQAALVDELTEMLADAKLGKLKGIACVCIEVDEENGGDLMYPAVAGDTGNEDALCWRLAKLADLIEDGGVDEDEDDAGD